MLLSFPALLIASAQFASAASIAEDSGWTPVYTVIPRPLEMGAALEGSKSGNTIPTFTDSVKSPLDGKTYRFTIVGSDPTKKAASTTVKYFPMAIRWHFPGGVVIDPTKPGCNDTVPVASRFFDGPMFTNVPNSSNGVALPKTQTTDAFQIAQFYTYTKNSNYHVLLSSMQRHVAIVDEAAPPGSAVRAGACGGSGHDLGEIPIYGYDAVLQKLILEYTQSASILPVLFSYNIVEIEGSCCVTGYHSVLKNHGEPQPYATGAYTDAGVFPKGESDIWAWQHEMGEIFNDPFIDNQTPAWSIPGGLGCQSNLEVGDPLIGTDYELKENGFTYHPQELAFFSWFFRQNPSIGTGGNYSYKGTFTSTPRACG